MLIRNISDTALLAAVYRARENEHPNGLFRDPFAGRLPGERGQEIAKQSRQALIVGEGLVLYLSPEEVGLLATDLAAHEQFRYWLLDITSPALLKMLIKKMGKAFDEASAPFKFAPADGPEFFSKFGWRPTAVRSIWHTAGAF